MRKSRPPLKSNWHLIGSQKGDTRLAYYGIAIYKKGEVRVVLKQSVHIGSGFNSLKNFLVNNQLQTLAAFLAKDFSKFTTKFDFPKLDFIVTKVIQWKNTIEPRYMSMEKLLNGKFMKFNTNNGWVNSEPTRLNLILQAFSYWTYHITKGTLLVVDLQGILPHGGNLDTVKKFVLTDPAIHHKELHKFGPTNCGVTGMGWFFKTHVCNKFCEQLGITKSRP